MIGNATGSGIGPTMNYANFPLDKRMPLPNSDAGNGEDFIDVERLLGMAARQAKVVAVCAVIGLFLGMLYLQTTPPKYVSVSSVLIDEGLNKIVDDISAASTTMQTDSAILSQIEILTSTRLAAVVVDKLKLDQNDAFMNPPQSALAQGVGLIRGLIQYVHPSSPMPGMGDISKLDPATRDALIAASRRDYAILKLQNEIRADRVGRSYVIALGYQATDPGLAKAITKAYADAYLADQLDASFDATERAAVWLQGRLTELRESSQQASLAVEKFRAEHGLSANSDGQLMSDKQLADLNAQLIVAQADTARASAATSSTSRSSTAAPTTPSTMPPFRATSRAARSFRRSRPATSPSPSGSRMSRPISVPNIRRPWHWPRKRPTYRRRFSVS